MVCVSITSKYFPFAIDPGVDPGVDPDLVIVNTENKSLETNTGPINARVVARFKLAPGW